MKKVSRKMKRSKVKVVLLSIAAGVLALVLIVLSVGQVVKRAPIPSFETVGQTISAYPLVRMLVKGDYEGYVLNASNGMTDTFAEAHYLQKETEKDVQLLSEAYEAAYGHTRPTFICIHSEYSDELSLKANAHTIISYAHVSYADGSELVLQLVRDFDGLYRCTMSDHAEPETTEESVAAKKQLWNALDFIADHKVQTGFIIETLMTTPTPYTEDPDLMERLAGRCRFLVNGRFAPDCADRIAGQLRTFYEQGYTVPKCNLSDVQFDKETNELYYRLYVTASDSEGEALLCARLPFTYEGLHPQTEVTVYRSGCGDALASDLENLFS